MNSKLKGNLYNHTKSSYFFFIGILMTLVAAYFTGRNVERQAKHKFYLVCNDLTARIEARLFAQEQLLHSGAALFEASDSVHRDDWHYFYVQPETSKKLPGMQGVGYSVIIPYSQLNNHINQIRNQGFPQYHVFPEGNRDTYTSIIYIEPFSDRNLKAFGFDMFSEPIRRKAMEMARDSNMAALSNKVKLIQEDTVNIQAGTLMYVPVYKKGVQHNTIDQRRKAIVGWVYSIYRMDDLMQGILGSWNELVQERIHMRIYDGTEPKISALLYDSQENELQNNQSVIEHRTKINFNGIQWTMVFTQKGGFGFFGEGEVLIVLICGFAISLLIFFLALSLTNTRAQALKIAQKLTDELNKSEMRFKNIIANHSSIMWMVDSDNGNIIEANEAAAKFYGYSISQLCQMNIKDINILPAEIIDESLKQSRSKKTNHFFYTHKLADGQLRDVEVYSSPIEWQEKNYYFAIIHDITERRNAEILLEQTRNNYENFFNTINDFLFVLDNHGKIIHFNQTVSNRLEYNKEELIGQSVLIVHPSERRDEAARIVTEMMEGKTEFCPIPIQSKNNKLIPVETRITRGTWDGKPVIFGVSKDISDLKISEEKFSKAFHSSSNIKAISIYETGEYIEVNKAFLELFNLMREEVIGKTSIELGIFNPEFRQRIQDDYLKNKKISNLELTMEVFGKTITGLFSADIIYIQDQKCWFTTMQNVTDRKLAQEAFKQSKHELETIISASPDGIALSDLNGHLQLVSDKMVEMFGYSIDEKAHLIGFSIFDLVHPTDQKFLKNNIAKLISGEKNQKVTQYLALKRDKATFNIEVNSTLITNTIDAPVQILLIARDITHRKQIDDILQKWARIFEYSGWGIVITSTDGKTLEMMNPAFAKMHGYSVADLLGKSIMEVIAPDEMQKWPIQLMKANELTHHSWETMHRRVDQSLFPALIDITIVNDQLGILQYYVINIMDISERKKTEEALLESETRLRLAIEGSKVGTWDWNIETGHVVYSHNWAEMLGFNIDELEPNIKTWENLLFSEDYESVTESLNKHLRGESSFYQTEHRMKTKQGDLKWILDRGMVVSYNSKGEAIRAIGTHIDIDQTKRTQIKLEKLNQQLKELDATKDKLFSIIAHDLKNPISGVLALSGLLLDNFKKYEVQKSEKFLEQINSASKNALNLLENLLYWARTQTGQLSFNPTTLMLLPLINDAIEVTRSAAKMKYINIETRVSDKILIFADNNLIQTVLRNLVTNAIKFTNPGGLILIEALHTNKEVEISVSDNGVGMNPQQLNKLFSSETTEITAGTANEKGSGLGLLLCKEFIEKHGGNIRAESTPGLGSKFIIVLPLLH